MPKQNSVPPYEDLISDVDAEGFYQTPICMAMKAIHARLTGADWALWTYLQAIDPHGDRMKQLPPVSKIAESIGVSERQIQRSLEKLKELGLYIWEPVVIRGQNLAGKKAKELCQKKKESKSSQQRKMTTLSANGQLCPKNDMEPLPNKGYSAPQTYSEYSNFIQTLSESERESFLNFGLEKCKALPKLPELPKKWIEVNWQELYAQFKSTPEAAASIADTDWTSHPDWEDWLAQMREGVPRFVALGTCFDNKKRRAITSWADNCGLIWGAEL